MSDSTAPYARLFAAADLPVRIPDWPDNVGIAVCRANGKTVALLPYHAEETGQVLRRRLPEEGGENLAGLNFYPGLRGAGEARIGYAEDQRLLSELDQALRSMPRLVEAVHDFAINFEFASEEGVALDSLSQATKRKAEAEAAAEKAAKEHLPVGYVPYDKPDTRAEVIAGAMLRPQGAIGIDLILQPDVGLPSRELPPEAPVLVREDSLRVAVPLAAVLNNGHLPPVLRLPAGSLLLGGAAGKPVPAMVLRRGQFLFVTPEFHSISAPALAPLSLKKPSTLPWRAILIVLLGFVLIAALAVGAFVWFTAADVAQVTPQAPVENLRSGLFDAPIDTGE